MQETENKGSVKTNVEYDSNPFTLTFKALGKFFEHNVGWAIAIVVMGLVNFFFQLVGNVLDAVVNEQRPASALGGATEILARNEPVNVAAVLAVVIVVAVVLAVVIFAATAFGVWVQGMFAYVSLKSLEGKSVSFSEAVHASTQRFMRMFGAQLLANLKIFGWTLLFIVPGIIASLRYKLLPYVIMDQPEGEKGVGASHERVKTLTKGRLIEVFGVGTVAAIVPFVGQLLDLAGSGAQYRQLQAYTDGNIEKPSKHWLNYLGLILIGCFALFMFGILVLVGIAAVASNA